MNPSITAVGTARARCPFSGTQSIILNVGRGCGSPVETSAYGSMQKRNRAGRRDLAPAVGVVQNPTVLGLRAIAPTGVGNDPCVVPRGFRRLLRVAEVTASPLPFCRFATFPLSGESSPTPTDCVSPLNRKNRTLLRARNAHPYGLVRCFISCGAKAKYWKVPKAFPSGFFRRARFGASRPLRGRRQPALSVDPAPLKCRSARFFAAVRTRLSPF